jgi:hypothetical protein
VSASFVSWPSSGLELDFSFTLELEDTHMEEEYISPNDFFKQWLFLDSDPYAEGHNGSDYNVAIWGLYADWVCSGFPMWKKNVA